MVDLKLCVLVSAGTSGGFKDTLDWSVLQSQISSAIQTVYGVPNHEKYKKIKDEF